MSVSRDVGRKGTQLERFSARLSGLPEPTRGRFGREEDPHAYERAHLTIGQNSWEHDLQEVLKLKADLETELGNPQEMRAERDGLEAAIRESEQKHSQVRDELAEREMRSPGAWARETFGERPDRPAALNAWEKGVRRVAAYRVQYEIKDQRDAIGPRPENGRQLEDWRRAQNEIERAERRLGRDVGRGRDGGIDIGF
jgi:hypothetical protein